MVNARVWLAEPGPISAIGADARTEKLDHCYDLFTENLMPSLKSMEIDCIGKAFFSEQRYDRGTDSDKLIPKNRK